MRPAIDPPKRLLNPVVFSQPDDGNIQVKGIELLPIWDEESDKSESDVASLTTKEEGTSQ